MSRYSRIALAAAACAAVLTCRARAAEAPTDAYGDPLPPGAVARLGSVRLRHDAMSVAWAPDGKTFASAGMDGTVRLWNAEDGKEVRRFRASNPSSLNSVIFLPDGKSLAAEGLDSVVHIWDLATGREVYSLPPERAGGLVLMNGRVAPGPEEGSVATIGADSLCRVLDLATGKSIRSLGAGVVLGSRSPQNALSADGRRFAAWSAGPNDLLTVWDTADGKELFHAPTGLKAVTGLTISPDGKTLAVFGGNPSRFALWDVDSGKEVRRIDWTGYGGAAAFTPNGKYFAVLGGDRLIHLWGVASGKELRQFPAPQWNPVNLTFGPPPLAFSPDGKRLVAGRGAALHLWDVETGEEVRAFTGHAGAVDEIGFSADGRRLLSCGKEGAARLWDVAAARQLAVWTSPKPGVFSMAVAPDAHALLAATGAGLDWVEFAGDKPTDRLLTYTPAGPAPSPVPTGFVVSPDGKTLAAYCPDHMIHLWDTKTGKDAAQLPTGVVERANVSHAVLAFSPDGKVLAAAPLNGSVRLLDVASRKEIRPLEAAAPPSVPIPAAMPVPPRQPLAPTLRNVVQILFAPDGRCVLCVADGELSLWETATGRDRMRAARPGVVLTRAAFSPAGDLMAAGSSSGTVYVFDARTGYELAALEGGHTGPVASLAFAPDGKTLASGGADGGIVIWDGRGWTSRPIAVAEVKPEKLSLLWKDLIDDDAARAYRAIRTLAASPKAAAPFLKERLVGVAGPDEKRIDQLIKDLDDDSFDVRENAQKELGKLGATAAPLTRKALAANPSPEARRRLQELVGRLKNDGAASEEVRGLRAVEALERSGAPEAVQALRALAKDAPNADVQQATVAALDRLERRKDGP